MDYFKISQHTFYEQIYFCILSKLLSFINFFNNNGDDIFHVLDHIYIYISYNLAIINYYQIHEYDIFMFTIHYLSLFYSRTYYAYNRQVMD